ncbi:MAG: tRNA (adenosine(37)-N6)-dimethylallyltransferase MiaA [Candidatus Nomurabacteria bacterium]|nr:tRNA (adenosine(37)-N6)-dimethylallyltransferase MiaA [Candidatus Nomurabacteria bacterium]
MKGKTKIIVILGQTATGKSDFAVEIAKNIGGEVISADSRQVYTGMDIGTGKITKKEMQGVSHHLLDVASPTTIFSVSKFKKMADKKIIEISKNGHIPIICGGTGFYIDALIDNVILPSVKPDKKLRTELEKKSTDELYSILKELDENRAENIDKKNPVRLIRAIEIAKVLGSVPSISKNPESKYDVLKIGLALPDEILKERINKRLHARIKSGMIKEVQNLYDQNISWRKLENFGLEYRYCAQFLQGKFGDTKKKESKEKMIELLNTEIWHYAKRQKTWFKRDKDTIWINPLETHERARALKKVKDFIK